MSSVSDDANNPSQPNENDPRPAEGQAGAAAGAAEGNTENQAAQPPVAPIIEHRVDKELNFVDLLQIVRRHIALIILIMTAVAVGVGYRYMTAQRLYRSNAVIHISQKDSGIDGFGIF